MDSRQLIDVQFNRAVEIVQGLPKTGPIQTGYEEKLTMYSLYKQATVGNVTSSRPGIFDMLGRAKWDAWAKHRDLDQFEAKWLYVDALLKALSKYSDKTIAKDLIDELRSYGGHSENLVSSYTLSRTGSRGSSSSSSTPSEDNSAVPPSHRLHDFQHSASHQRFGPVAHSENSDDGEVGDETRELPAMREISQQQRPRSSISFSSRYRTPQTTSFALSSPPPRRMSVPPAQPLPNFETQSAFADLRTATAVATPSAYTSPTSYAASQIHTAEPPYRNQSTTSRHGTTTGAHLRPSSRPIAVPLEHAIENMQAHLAALTERVDTLESSFATHSHPQSRIATSLHSRTSSDRGSPADSQSVSRIPEWDVDDMGLWTLVLKPLLRNLSFIRHLLFFFFRSGEDRSPLLIIIRRLCLDISFVMVVLTLLRTAWIKTGTRRKEVVAALAILWGAITGKRRILRG